jgi:hypothetical protein
VVELHYEDIDSVPVVHWRIIVDDEAAAIAQAAQDVAEGRNPLAVVEAGSGTWDYEQDYNPRDWKTLVPRAALHRRARSLGAAFGG